MRTGRTRYKGDFQLRYCAYARDHGMTSEQMLVLDKDRCPDALLTPYFLWLSGKWFEWGQLNPDREVHGVKEEAEFERWLDQRAPASDGFTCECHMTLSVSGHRR